MTGVQLIEVDSADDPRLDDFRNLHSPGGHATTAGGASITGVRPDRRGIVIAEGVNVVERLTGSPYPVRAVFGVPARVEALAPVLEPLDVPVFVADKWLLSDVVGFRVTRGVLASADRPVAPSVAALLAGAERVAVLEGMNDFENLGALFRNAAAFGVDAVLLDARCADPLYRRSVRVSMGHVLRVPFAVLPGPWPDALDGLRAEGFRLLALTPRAWARPLREVDRPAKWAVLLGAEGPGLTEGALARADELVRVPMAGGVDSLNVATAAAVAFAQLC
jgi:tRNA G18 (ribose-2'-O)-methylase SpoU